MNDLHLRLESELGAPAVVITGATEGIGRALAEEFARDGHALLLVARDHAQLAATASALSRRYQVEVKATAQDLSTAEGCAGVEQALRRFGLHAEILVNNAGMMASGFFQDQPPRELHRLLNLDICALVDLTARFLPGMLARGHGGVLNVASMLGFMPVPYQAAYAAAKAFVLSMSKSLAYETMGTGVTVSVLAPGAVSTKLHAKAGAENSYYLSSMPTLSAEQVARAAYRGFRRGRSVIVPGLFNPLLTLLIRFVPDFLLIPAMGFLFRVRDVQGNPLGPEPLRAPKPMPRLQPVRFENAPDQVRRAANE